MAHNEDINPLVKIELVLARAQAARFAVQTQYIVSERMLELIAGVLTEEQVELLKSHSVEFQPVVFPKTAEVVR